MNNAFIQYIKKNRLFSGGDKLLVAVSGGLDSMMLCHLLIQNRYIIQIAHCNFKLRNEESDGDEAFVKDFCKRNKIPFISKKFDTKTHAKKNSISIQMAARELRYEWFEQLRKKNKLDYILTAHHASDNAETFFINLIRGSGLNGLKGILPKHDKIIRPLLFATQDELEKYARQQNISYRTDSSNAEDKYSRNYIRQHIIPQLKRLNPSFETTLLQEMEIIRQADNMLAFEIEKSKKKLVHIKNGVIHLTINDILKSKSPQLLLFESLKDYHFNSGQVFSLYDILQEQPGQEFRSPTHTLIKDRDYLLIREQKKGIKTQDYSISKRNKHISHPLALKISFQKGNLNTLSKNLFKKNIALLDAEKLHWPLQLNKWQQGDSFRPLGMQGFKKLSDFFVSEKYSLFEKEEQWILRSGNEIVWIVGRRIDDRFKVTGKTKKICIIELHT